MTTHFVIPYKNRLDCLFELINKFPDFINESPYIEDNVSVTIVEPDTDEPFNLGFCINAGFKLIEKSTKDDDVFWFHPADCIPIQFDTRITKGEIVFSAKGKAIGMRVADFKKINGFSIKQYGYGCEDHEISARAKLHGVTRYNDNSSKFEYLNSSQKSGYKNMRNYAKNSKLIQKRFTKKSCKEDGLSNTRFESIDCFDVSCGIIYNKIIPLK